MANKIGLFSLTNFKTFVGSFQKKPDWVLGEKEGKSKSTSEAPPETQEARMSFFAVWLLSTYSFPNISFSLHAYGHCVVGALVRGVHQ